MTTYLAIKELSEEHKDYSVLELCKLEQVSRCGIYYKWPNRVENPNDELNKTIADKIETMHAEHPDMRYPDCGMLLNITKIFMLMIKE